MAEGKSIHELKVGDIVSDFARERCPMEEIPIVKEISHPMRSPNPISTLESAREIAKRNGLRYVYDGNVLGHIHHSTFYPSCNRKVI